MDAKNALVPATRAQIVVFRQSDKNKNPLPVRVRTLTRDEILALRPGQHVAAILNNGRLGVVKINGMVRTWKRDPDRVEVPVKYGMHEYATLSLTEAMGRLVREEEG